MDHDPKAASKKPAGALKERMRQWAIDRPDEAAQRKISRDRRREQCHALVRLSALIGRPEMIEKAGERLDELLDATVAVVVRDAKGVDQIKMVSDNKTRLEAIKIVAAYSEGLPVARQLQIHADFKDLDQEKRELLLGAEAVLDALDELDKEFGRAS